MIRWRLGFFALFLFCVSTLAFAWYLENYEFVIPCPLCLLQRWGFRVFGALALLAAIIPLKRASWVWPSLLTLSALAGAAISARHIYIQNFADPGTLVDCGVGIDTMLKTMPWFEVLRSTLIGHGDCARIDWTLFGLTLPMLSLLGYLGLAVAAWLIRWWQIKKS